MRLEMINGIRLIIVAFMYYVITFTFSGWFESLVAKYVGDDAPEQTGFLTLNPLEHFNVVGFGIVLWCTFYASLLPIQFIPGWGRHIPLMPEQIHGKYFKARILTEYLARSIAHLLILLTAATALMLISGAVNIYGLAAMSATNTTSLKEGLVLLLQFMLVQNLLLFVIHFILGGFKYCIYFYMPQFQTVSFGTILLTFIALVVALSIFGPLLQILAIQLIEGIHSLLLLMTR